MRKLTRRNYGKAATAGEESDTSTQWFRRGSGDSMQA